MSRQEYHKGKLKKVDLSQYDNDAEKYFEARYRYEFAANEDNPNGLNEKEIQEAYARECNYNTYSGRGPWRRLWFDNTDDYEQIVEVNGELWEVADIELDGEETIMHKVSDTEYIYYTSFYNGGCCLSEALEYGLKLQLKKKNDLQKEKI